MCTTVNAAAVIVISDGTIQRIVSNIAIIPSQTIRYFALVY